MLTKRRQPSYYEWRSFASVDHRTCRTVGNKASVYKRPDGIVESEQVSNAEVARSSGLGYNSATESKESTYEQVNAVQSWKAQSEWALGPFLKTRYVHIGKSSNSAQPPAAFS